MRAARRITPRIAPWVLTALLAAALPLAAQSRPQGAVSEEIQVNDVLLDALVTDRHDNVVLGLGKDDFVVTEDGRPVELNDVTFYSNRRFLESSQRAEELGIDPQAVPAERYFILFFQDQRQLLPRLVAQQLDAGRRARQWVETELLPNDYVAVVSYRYALKLYQDFTNDRDALARAIDEASQGRDPERYRPADEGAPSLFRNLSREKAKDVDRIYEALEVVGDAAGAVHGRKNLILFSIGFGEVDSFGFYRPDYRYYPDMVRALNDHNVAVYTIDLIPTSFGGNLPNLLSNSLSNLAADTGGRYYFNFISFLTPLEQIGQELNGYYLLSYTSRHPQGESGYQKVEVETRNPEFRIRTRQGYEYGA